MILIFTPYIQRWVTLIVLQKPNGFPSTTLGVRLYVPLGIGIYKDMVLVFRC